MPSELEHYCQTCFDTYLSKQHPTKPRKWSESSAGEAPFHLTVDQQQFVVLLLNLEARANEGLCAALERAIIQKTTSVQIELPYILLLPNEFIDISLKDYMNCFSTVVNLPLKLSLVYLVMTSNTGRVLYSSQTFIA